MGLLQLIKSVFTSPCSLGRQEANIPSLLAAALFIFWPGLEALFLIATPDYFMQQSYSISFSDISAQKLFILSFLTGIISSANILIFFSFFFSVKWGIKKFMAAIFIFFICIFSLLSFPSSELFVSFAAICLAVAIFHIRKNPEIFTAMFRISSASGLISIAYAPFWFFCVKAGKPSILEVFQLIFSLWSVFVIICAASERFKKSIVRVIVSLAASALFSVFILYMLRIQGLISENFFKLMILQS